MQLGCPQHQQAVVVITWKEVLEGAEKACENALRLTEDTLLLHHGECYETAYSIVLLAWYERNKAGLLKEQENVSRSRYEKIFRHERRLQAYPEYEHLLKTATSITKKPSWDQKTIDAARQLDLERKVLGLYVHLHEKNNVGLVPVISRGVLDSVNLKQKQIVLDQHWMSDYQASQSKLTCERIRQCIQQIKLGTPASTVP
jgi:AbiV family abortive infection protein